MAMHHKISSNVYDRYHGGVKAEDLRSQKHHERGNLRTGSGEEGSKLRPKVYDGIDRNFKSGGIDGRRHQSQDKIGDSDHRYGKIDKHGHSRNYDSYDFAKHDSHHKDAKLSLYDNLKGGIYDIRDSYRGITQIQYTRITITHSPIFSGSHLGSIEKSNEAHQNFLNAALSYIKNPSEQAYKSLNESMMKLMDPRFTAANIGGAAKVSIRDVNGTTMAKFTMEITPAPTKSLEEAREDLKNAFSTRRDGEKDIASIRAEAHANYIRALSEKFKQDGVISHTNNAPTTPVFKSSVIYVAKITQVNVIGLRELKKPNFEHNLHGKLTFKNQHGFWNNYRQNHKSYVDMLKHDSKKSHIDNDSKSRKAIEAKHDLRGHDNGKAERSNHKHNNKPRMGKVS